MARRPRPRRRRRNAWRGLALLVVAVLVVSVAWVAARQLVWHRSPQPPPPVPEACTVAHDELSWPLTPEQAENAARIVAQTATRGLPDRAATIALATAAQESVLINLDYGDRDSLGLFQQRPSQGWGTAAQVMDSEYATGAFLDRLVTVDGWQSMSLAEAAQAVQRSAAPDAYATHEMLAAAWASALLGGDDASLDCSLVSPGATPEVEASTSLGGSHVPAGTDAAATADPRGLYAVLIRDFPQSRITPYARHSATAGASGSATGTQQATEIAQPTATAETVRIRIDRAVRGTRGEALDQLTRAAGRWAVAEARAYGVTSVTAGDQAWTRRAREQGWATAKTAAGAGVIDIRF